MEEAPATEVVEGAGGYNPMLVGSALVFGHAVKHVINAGFFVILPEIQLGLGLTNSAVGALSTVRTLGAGLTNLPAGYLSDRFSHRWAIILGAAMATVGAFHFLVGVSSAYWLVMLTATLGAVGVTFWHPPAIAALSQMFSHRRGLAISFHGTGGSIGEALGPITVGALLGIFTWRTMLKASLAPTLATGAVVWMVMRGFREVSAGPGSFKEYLTSVLALLRRRSLITILLITSGAVSVQAIAVTFLPIYLQIDLGYSAFTMTAYVSSANVVGIATQPFMGFFSDRFSRKAVILPCVFLLGVTVLAIPFAGSGLPLLLVVAAMGAFVFSLMSIFLAAALDVAEGDVPATTVSLVFGFAVIVSGMTPFLAGVLADDFGVKAAFFLAGGIALATAAFTATQDISR